MSIADKHAEFYFKNFDDAERADIEAEIHNAFADVQAGRYDDELKQAGICRGDLAQANEVSYDIEVGQYLTGAEWALIQIIVAASTNVAVPVLIDVWTHIILPRLEQRYGSGRLRRKSPEKE